MKKAYQLLSTRQFSTISEVRSEKWGRNISC